MATELDITKVMIVDDEESLREGAERILTRMNYRVWKASRGEEGLEILKSEPIAIILLDMKMPGMDGIEVLKRVMEMDRGILVIVITGYATVETAIEAMKLGAYDFIPKPYEPDQLRIAVNRARDRIQLKLEAEELEVARNRTLSDLRTEKSRTLTILDSLPNGVLVTNTEGQVVLINPAFRQHLGLDHDLDPGMPIETYLDDSKLCNLINEISKGQHIDYEDIPAVDLEMADGKYFLARCRPVLGEKKECLGAVVNLMDISTLKALDQLKSEYVAKVTHELRSPLSVIHEQLAMILTEAVGPETDDDQRLLTRAKEKTKGLISTIGDLLDLSRIEAGVAVKDQRPVEIDKLLQNIVDFLGDRAKSKKQTLSLEIGTTPITPLKADAMALESVFGNLIANAINYTQDGGEILVKADMSGKNARVVVTDNGFGIEAKHLEKIFERFYRVKNDKTKYITGTGLGLPIVKGIVDSMGGYIDVNSEPGKGTAFTIILPT